MAMDTQKIISFTRVYMKTKKKQEIVIKCSKCGKKQVKSKDKSNKNWDYFDTSVPCCCGGEFKMYLE